MKAVRGIGSSVMTRPMRTSSRITSAPPLSPSYGVVAAIDHPIIPHPITGELSCFLYVE